jgi:hypothetical protein
MKGITPSAPFVATMAFERAGAGTQVTVTTEVLFRGLLRVIGPLFIAWYRRAWGQGLRRLKAMMEAGEL